MNTFFQARLGQLHNNDVRRTHPYDRRLSPSQLRPEAGIQTSFKAELASASSIIQKEVRKDVGLTHGASAGPGSGKQVKNQHFEYTVQPGDNLWTLAVKKFHVNLEDLVKDNRIHNPDLIFPGQKLIIRKPALAPIQEVVASWYGDQYHGRPMANGEPFDMHAATIAHREIPLGTKVELENPATGEKVKAVVTDRGPFIAGRDIDLSYGLASRLSLVKQGVGRLLMKVI